MIQRDTFNLNYTLYILFFNKAIEIHLGNLNTQFPSLITVFVQVNLFLLRNVKGTKQSAYNYQGES